MRNYIDEQYEAQEIISAILVGSENGITKVTPRNFNRVRRLPYYRDCSDNNLALGCIIVSEAPDLGVHNFWILWPNRTAYGYGPGICEYAKWFKTGTGRAYIRYGERVLDMGCVVP